MKKLNKLFWTSCLVLSAFSMHAQTYLFNSPEGYGSGVTGGGNGPISIVTTKAELQTALLASGPGRVIVKGALQCDYLTVLVTNKTILGLPGSKLFTNDQTSGASGILNLKPGSTNVILRNLTFVGPGAYDSDGRDNLGMDGCTKMWVDHCDFQDGMDGNYDHKGLSDNITVSWCRFRYLKAPRSGGSGGTNDHRFTNLVGSDGSDAPADGKFSITWQYCWWDQGCVERMTRARNAQLHFLNCYWNTSVGKVLLGLEKTDAYVENSVFAGSGTKYQNYGGTVRLTSVGSTAAPTNVGVCPAPTYTHEAINASGVISALTGTCGAGATLTVTENGAVSTSCGTQTGPTLETNSTENQSVTAGTAISSIVYTWGGSATGVTVTGLPTGLSGTTNNSAKTYTISGTPTASGTYNISTTQASGSPATSSGTITLTLAVPTNVNATSTSSSATINWSTVTGATGYVVNFCSPSTGTAPKRQWDFTATWTTNASKADANLEIDPTNANRFNYVPATTNAELKFASGTAVPELAGLLFTQGGLTKVRLGFGTSLVYLNGAGITVSIPCAVGDKVTITGPAGNAAAIDRGYSVSGGTLVLSESANINGSGILTTAAAIGTWVYTATATSVAITSVTGGMNIQKITIGGSGGASCKEYTVSGGSSNTYTIPDLAANTTYTYQVKAINGAYSTSQNIKTANPLGVDGVDGYFSQASLYPNPSTNTFQVGGIQGTATVSVLDMSGQLILSQDVLANEPISIDALNSGVYMVKIATANGTVLKKLMKK
jgi:pectate lyase